MAGLHARFRCFWTRSRAASGHRALVDTTGAARSWCPQLYLLPAAAQGSMTDANLAATIDAAWEDRDKLTPSTRGVYRDAVEAALDGLDGGQLRVAEKTAGGWQVRQWLKKAVLLSFRLNDMVEIPGGPI